MNTKAVLRAVLAVGYIGAVVLLINFITRNTTEGGGEETLLIPVAMLSLLTLSVAVMGYLFFYEPAALYLSDKKEEALSFFLTTVAVFAVITGVLFTALLFVV